MIMVLWCRVWQQNTFKVPNLPEIWSEGEELTPSPFQREKVGMRVEYQSIT